MKDTELEIPYDPVIEAYKKDVDVTLLIEALRKTPEERLLSLIAVHDFVEEVHRSRRERNLPVIP